MICIIFPFVGYLYRINLLRLRLRLRLRPCPSRFKTNPRIHESQPQPQSQSQSHPPRPPHRSIPTYPPTYPPNSSPTEKPGHPVDEAREQMEVPRPTPPPSLTRPPHFHLHPPLPCQSEPQITPENESGKTQHHLSPLIIPYQNSPAPSGIHPKSRPGRINTKGVK